MAANVESMFYVREAPWHGLGTKVDEILCSGEALNHSGLNWQVTQKAIISENGIPIMGYKANIRDTDNKVLGIVTDKYKVVQNDEAFAFTDSLIGEGVRYETAGSLQEGKRVWLLAKLPETYIIADDEIEPYIVFSNSHDGGTAIRVAMTPIRVVCQNTLNLALRSSKRIWSTVHTGDMGVKLQEAQKTLLLAKDYMDHLTEAANEMTKINLTDRKVIGYINDLIPLPDNASRLQEKNIKRLRGDLKTRYFEAPDLANVPMNCWRLVNAVSDFATHTKPLRNTPTFKENVFVKTVEGNPLIDKAYEIIKSLAA